MSLSQALISAISGLKANQSSLALVSANVANAGTAGYIRKSVNQVAVSGSGTGIGVRISAIQRELDTYVQRQLRVENSGAAYATTRSQFYDQLQAVYGAPGTSSTVESAFNKFSEALQALSSSPDDSAARASVVSTAQLLAQQLNTMSTGIQSLRQNAELGISDSISQANDAMQQIASLNARIASSPNMDAAAVTMYDQRDAYIDKLSKLMDINIIANDNNQLAIYTNSGVQLVGITASTLSFDEQGTMSANTQWSADPSKRTVGTIQLTSANGSKVDLIQTNAIRSGQIAA